VNETSVTVVGNLVDDPRLRSTDAGVVVASFRVASTSRRYDRESRRWVDSASLFLSVSCWRTLAGNAVASLRKGDPVVVTGRLSTRTWEKDGQVRSSCELEAVAVGPDLARGTAVFRRSPRAVAPGSPPGDDAEPESPGSDEVADPAPEVRLAAAGV
jgi:single-strand DNA-binding protein